MLMNPFSPILVFGMAALTSSALAQRDAEQVSRTGSFDLPCSADTAFPLFSPEGERHWVQGWDPRAVFPDKIAFSVDTVFREGQGDKEAVWTILDADSRTHRAEYVRLAPAGHTAHIVVKVGPQAPERSHVVVSYTVTAFGENADALLDGFSESAFAAKMRAWQQQITTYLENRR
jgi:hypothetical protein